MNFVGLFGRFLGKPGTYNLRDGIEEGDEIAVCKCKFYDNCMNFSFTF